VEADEDGHGFTEDAVPDEDTIEAVSVFDGEWPTGQRESGEAGERRRNPGELGQARSGRNRAIRQVVDAVVSNPHRENYTESRTEERQQMIVAEYRVPMVLQRLRASRGAARLSAVTYISGHG
jgi:hypothetical protein